MPISLTYVFVAILAGLGIENAQEVADALLIVVTAIAALWARHRAGGVNIFGWKKKD